MEVTAWGGASCGGQEKSEKAAKKWGCLTWVLRDEQGFTRQTEKVREEKHCSTEDCLQGCLLARDA